MKNILCTTAFGLTLLVVVACGQKNSASADQWLPKQVKFPYVEVKKGDFPAFTKYYDCDSEVIVYNGERKITSVNYYTLSPKGMKDFKTVCNTK